MEFYISATTDVGNKRETNQDCLFVRKLKTGTGEMVLAVLCDGMGGLKHGELASAALTEAFSVWMYTALPELAQRPLEDQVIRRQWNNVIAEQNEKIRTYGKKHHCSLGTTVTAMLLTEYRYYLLNIGDTRAYELSYGVRQLTEDHTILAREVALGNLTPEQAEQSPARNVLTRCVGVKESVQPDLFFGDVKRETLYMLCSDGFRHCISNEEIENTLWKGARRETESMKQNEDFLIRLCKERGETDNISVISIFVR